MNGKTTSFLLICSLLFLSCTAILYVNVATTNAHLDSDSHEYLASATTYYKTNSFIKPGADIPRFPLGYPFVIAMFFKLLGRFSGTNLFFIILFQMLCALASGLLLFAIARRLFNNRVALISFALFACNLGFIVFPNFLLIETILVLLLLLFFERLTLFFATQRTSLLMTATFILGLSTLFKPVGLYYIFALIPALFLFIPTSFLRTCTLAGLALFCFYLPITTYVTVNGMTTGNYYLTRLDTESLHLWLWPRARAREQGTTYLQEKEKVSAMLNKDYEGTKQKFYEHIKAEPALFIKTWLSQVLKTFAGLFTSNLKVLISDDLEGGDVSFFSAKAGSGAPVSLPTKIHAYIASGTESVAVITIGYLEMVYNLLLYLFCFIALLALLARRSWLLLYLASSYIFYFSMVTGFDGCARYRMTFEWLLIILAAYGIYLLLPRTSNKVTTSKETT